jgi:ABC-2 type transport system ATP-binding protein
MRLIHLPTSWTILVDFLAWLIIHIAVIWFVVRIPGTRFNPDGWLYRTRPWEDGGNGYQRFFRIKKWKTYLPDGAPLLSTRGFPKKNLQEKSPEYLRLFLRETCRAELTHWLTLAFAPFFFLRNPLWVGFFMILYALTGNIPLIMAQRYNRARLRRIIQAWGCPLTMKEPILRVQNLGKKYDSAEAVCGISFEVQPGGFFGLLGPNGAGKTTTIGMLAGWIEPTAGRVEIRGMDFSARPRETKRMIGLVPQSFAFYPSLSARENLSFFGRLYGMRGKAHEGRISFALGVASLTDRADQTVDTFSNGMKRRLNIAIGLLHEPAVLILDEPTVGIDTQSRSAILENLKRLNADGMTVLYTTHYIEEAQDLCDRVAILDRGKIIALDTPRALIQSFGKGIIRMEFHEALDETLLGQIAAYGALTWVDGQRKRLHLETDRTGPVLRELLGLKEKREALFKNLDVMEPDLETVFIHLTGRGLRD